MPIQVQATKDGIDRLLAALPQATARVSVSMAEEVQRDARANLEDPMGPLAESILLEGPDQVGSTEYMTKAGPTLVYGRQRELGGTIEPVSHTFLTAHYRAPGYWMWDFGDGRGLRDVFALSVHQEGQFYLKRAVEENLLHLYRIARRIWADVLRSAA